MGGAGVGYDMIPSITPCFHVHDLVCHKEKKSRPTYLYSGGIWGQGMAFSGSQKMNMNEISVDGGIDYQRQWGDKGRLFASYQIRHAPNRMIQRTDTMALTPPCTPEITSTVKDIRTEICDRTTQHNLTTDLTIPLTRINCSTPV